MPLNYYEQQILNHFLSEDVSATEEILIEKTEKL